MTSGQAEHLIPMIEQALSMAGKHYGDCGLIAVVNGPGAFTGIRIGLAAAKALALALDIPVVGIGTFEAVLHTALQDTKSRGYEHYGVVLETKRMDYYFQHFDGQGNALTPGGCVSAEDIRHTLSEERTLVAGDAVTRLLGEWGQCPGEFTFKEISLADPIVTAKRSKAAWSQSNNTEIGPIYLRAPDVTMPKTPNTREK